MGAVPLYPTPHAIGEGGAAVFADAHLGQVESDADDFLETLEGLAGRGTRTVVLLGDIFHYFIGDNKFQTPLVKRVVDAWRGLASRGVGLRYVEGNRDFFLRRSSFAEPFAAYGLTDALQAGPRRFAFVHGDRVNTRDLPYRFWRTVSKNPLSHAAMKVLPGGLARSIVARTEARLYQTNFKHKRHLPEECLRQEARRARAAGFDELLVGHFHVEKVFSEAGGVARLLPAWLEERKHAEIAVDGTLTIVEESSASRAMRRGTMHSPTPSGA